ncbi:MAG: hypothetical protein R8M45_10680 [Ghiorsea sp.]
MKVKCLETKESFLSAIGDDRNIESIAVKIGATAPQVKYAIKKLSLRTLFEHKTAEQIQLRKYTKNMTKEEFLELIGDSVLSIEIQEKTGLSGGVVYRLIEKLGLSDIVVVNPKNMTPEQKEICLSRKKQRSIKKYGVESIAQLKSTKDKMKATNLEKYGVESASQLDSAKDKMKATNLERYGVEHVLQSSIIHDRAKATKLEKYGVESYSQTQEYKDRCKATNLDRYGVESYSKTGEYKDKCKSTCSDRYGEEYYYQSQEFKEKSKATCLEKYGVESYSQTQEGKDKGKATCLEKYSTESYTQTQDCKEKYRATVIETAIADGREWCWDAELFIAKYNKYVSVCDMGIGEEIHHSTIYSIIKRLGLTEELGIGQSSGRSSGEINVYDYMCTLSDNVEHSNRKLIYPKEIDIYLPDHNLAIEFNGLYWHSEMAGGKDKNYHKNKMEACSDLGINLVMIPDYQWDNDITREVWKSRLAYLVGKAKSTIYARKCDIIDVSRKDKTKFMVSNHLQGGGHSTIRYGLEHKGELVACMTFSHKCDVYTLERFACSKYTSVVGGFSKLLKRFIKNNEYSSIISFADYGYSDGGVYESNGFVNDGLNPPNYAYTLDYRRILNKQTFRKEKLAILEGFEYDSAKTERANMLANGYDIIWGCGIVRYKLENK